MNGSQSSPSISQGSNVSISISRSYSSEGTSDDKPQNDHILPPIMHYEVDNVGNGTFQVTQFNLFNKKSIEINKSIEVQYSARGLSHRSVDTFRKQVSQQTKLISNLKRSEKRTTGHKYVPSAELYNPHFQRAIANERLHKIDAAIADYTMCIRTNLRHAEAYCNRAGLYKLKKDYSKAIEDMNKAIEINPSNIDFRMMRSHLFRESNDYLSAVNDVLLSRAIIRQPSIGKTLEAGGEVRLDGDLQYASKISEDPILLSLRIPGAKRTDFDLQPIMDFVKEIKLFQGFAKNRELLSKIASGLELQNIPKHEFVFNEGDPGNHFYLILDGEISIVRKKVIKIDPNDQNAAFLMDMIPEEDSYNILVKLFRGNCFGETALENAGGKRSAGAKATQFSRLLVMSATVYLKIISQYRSALKEQVKQALITSQLFQGWDEDKMDRLSTFAILRSFNANNDIFKAGDRVEYLMMIKSGIVKLMKGVAKPDTSALLFAARNHTLTDKEEIPGLWVLNKNWRNRLDAVPTGEFTDEDGADIIDEDSHDFTVGVLGTGQVFGELSILDPNQPSSITAVSFTSVELFCFEKEVLLAMDIKFNFHTMNCLNESLTLHDPPAEKLGYYFRSRLQWELRKNKLISKLTDKTKTKL
eukprot:gene13799-18509_t